MRRNNKYIICALVSLLFLSMLSVSVFALTTVLKKSDKESLPDTEFIYVYADEKTEASETLEKKWILKEYDEKIGVYNESGVLLSVIDTYTKTLPQTDRELLREGIEILTEKELNAAIEDYTD